MRAVVRSRRCRIRRIKSWKRVETRVKGNRERVGKGVRMGRRSWEDVLVVYVRRLGGDRVGGKGLYFVGEGE